MKKIYTLAIALFLFSVQSFAQTTLYSNDFESYTVGLKIAQQAGSPWTTWSNAPGGTEDAIISSTQSHSPTKAINVLNNNDLVLDLFDKTSGRFKISWYMYVESGKLGYFNMLNDFAGTNSLWALQVYIYNDSMYVDAGGTSAAKTTFTTNNWKHVEVIVDLDDDFATFYLDNVEIISYQWSKGAFGTNNSLKLDGVNFYGWNGANPPTPTTQNTSGYYIDDLVLDSVPTPQAPSNLVATLVGPDIEVNWTAPTTTPDSYKLSRNGKVVVSTTNTSYTDLAPWANTYTYKARAHYQGLGYSHSSNADTATVPGGVERDLVLFEGGTGTWCQYCPGAAMGLRDLIEVNNKNATAIEYHSGDSYEIGAGLSRISYYGITGFPTVIADGRLEAVGANATVSSYPTYLAMYEERFANPGFHLLDCSIVPVSQDNYQATITMEESFTAFTANLKLFAALTESNIPESWGNQSEVDFVCRALYPNENGTDVDFSVQNPQTVTINFSTTGFVKDNCEFVVFLQHGVTKEVTQTTMVKMSSVIGMDELKGEKIGVYPNPASDYVQILSNGKGTLDVYDISGKIQFSTRLTQPTHVIDISNLNPGVYFMRVNNTLHSFTQKLVVE